MPEIFALTFTLVVLLILIQTAYSIGHADGRIKERNKDFSIKTVDKLVIRKNSKYPDYFIYINAPPELIKSYGESYFKVDTDECIERAVKFVETYGSHLTYSEKIKEAIVMYEVYVDISIEGVNREIDSVYKSILVSLYNRSGV
jgi:hypothetical protein